MKIVIKNLAVDIFLGIIRLAIEVSDENNSLDCNFFHPVSNDNKPAPAALESWIFSRQLAAEQLFNGRFNRDSAVGKIAPTPSVPEVAVPVVPAQAPTAPVAPPAVVPPPAAPIMSKPAGIPPKGPQGIPPPPAMPKPAVPGPVAAPKPATPPPVPAAVTPPPQMPVPVIGTVYNRTNPEHTNVLRNILVAEFTADWGKNETLKARAKSMIDLLDQKVVVMDASGKTVHSSFKPAVILYMKGVTEKV